MLDANLFRYDLENTARRLARKKVERSTIDELVAVMTERRRLIQEADELRSAINTASKTIGQLMAAGKRDEGMAMRGEVSTKKTHLPEVEAALAEAEQKVEYILLRLPNLPADEAPDGTEEKDNRVIRTWGPDPASFAQGKYRPHWEIASELGIFDGERASKISGSMFAMLRGDGSRLLRALVSFALELNRERYEEVTPPHMVHSATFTATGHLPKFAAEAYHTADDDLWLIPTGEVPLMGMHRDEILDEAELPRRYMAYTVCFRREAGAAGKDTRGMQRLHEFHKVELVKLCTPEQTPAEFEALIADACRPLELLNLPYRVVDLCTGDLTFGSARTFDLEVYAPGLGRWLEVSSCGIYTDFQTRRGNIRFRRGEGKPEFCHAMNGSGLATPRVWAAIVEHYQQPDGSLRIPEPLVDYMKQSEIRRKA